MEKNIELMLSQDQLLFPIIFCQLINILFLMLIFLEKRGNKHCHALFDQLIHFPLPGVKKWQLLAMLRFLAFGLSGDVHSCMQY